jgi:alpha-glucosidase
MYFTKYPHPANFVFPDRLTPTENGNEWTFDIPASTAAPAGLGTIDATSWPGDIHHVTVRSPRWPRNHRLEELHFEACGSSENSWASRIVLDPDFGLQLVDADGHTLLVTASGRGFGVCGTQSLWCFERGPDDRFYGMGEKWLGRLELSQIRTKFWNTDIWGDFAMDECIGGHPDPAYVSIPYVALRRGDSYVGILVDNPEAVFIDTGAPSEIESLLGVPDASGTITIGGESGPVDLVIIRAESLRELTMKLQLLVGTTPLPPAWALGYHQSRWGYAGHENLAWLNDQLDRHRIPCDGLWLDIDYMDGYRVFTFSKTAFDIPRDEIAEAQSGGRHVVPILDPGVKKEPGNPVFESGVAAGAFCLNPQGEPYTGMVWPGETVFPDFSTDTGRAWWKDRVREFASNGIGGVWIDMNDPSTGDVDNHDMLFEDGKTPHAAFHNQYATGMARATREGICEAHPEKRPFVLSRSGSVGISRHAAVWTGDNHSNRHHLALSIPTTLNLALSGVPFNGPDVGGFGGDVSDDLMVDWIKAGFLFPFFRIHAAAGTRHQEPWSLGPEALEVCTEYIRSRYRLRPCLYNLFAEHEISGAAVITPVTYAFPDDPRFDTTIDQYMVGPSLLFAPFLAQDETERSVEVPHESWFDWPANRWTGGGTMACRRDPLSTPLFIRNGAIVPLSTVAENDNRWDGAAVEFLVCSAPGNSAVSKTCSLIYRWDDGVSNAYREGGRSAVRIETVQSDGGLEVSVVHTESGYGRLVPVITVLESTGAEPAVSGSVDGKSVTWSASNGVVRLAGCDRRVTRWTPGHSQ